MPTRARIVCSERLRPELESHRPAIRRAAPATISHPLFDETSRSPLLGRRGLNTGGPGSSSGQSLNGERRSDLGQRARWASDGGRGALRHRVDSPFRNLGGRCSRRDRAAAYWRRHRRRSLRPVIRRRLVVACPSDAWESPSTPLGFCGSRGESERRLMPSDLTVIDALSRIPARPPFRGYRRALG